MFIKNIKGVDFKIIFVLITFNFLSCSAGNNIEKYYISTINKPENAIKIFIDAFIQEFPDSLRNNSFPKSGIVKYIPGDINSNVFVPKCISHEFYNPNAILLDDDCNFLRFEILDYPNARYFYKEIYFVSEKNLKDLEDGNKFSVIPRIAICMPFLENFSFFLLDSLLNISLVKAGVKNYTYIYSPD